jgi:hypothetical protein
MIITLIDGIVKSRKLHFIEISNPKLRFVLSFLVQITVPENNNVSYNFFIPLHSFFIISLYPDAYFCIMIKTETK